MSPAPSILEDQAQLAPWVRHARYYGVEGVFEDALRALPEAQLEQLEVELRALNRRWRPPARWREQLDDDQSGARS